MAVARVDYGLRLPVGSAADAGPGPRQARRRNRRPMNHFQWNGDVYPVPRGWDGLSAEDWFYQLETVRDRIMHADQENLEPLYDQDGDPLDPEEVLLIRVFGFQDGGHWEAFRGWG